MRISSLPVTTFLVGFLALAPLLSACGDDDAGADEINRACGAFCSKFAECDLLLGMSAEACASNCRSQAMMGSGSSTCEVSESEADACISAIGDAQCSALMMGMTPPACDLCPASSTPPPPTPPGSPDAGGGAGCADLATCCSQLPMESQEGCQSLADSGNDSLCATAVSGYRGAGMCS